MAWDWITQLIPSVATLAATGVGLTRSQGKLRRNIRADAETLKVLPSDSEAYRTLAKYLDLQVTRLCISETEGSRDWSGFGIGLVIALASGYGAIWLYRVDGWWRWGTIALAPLAVICLVGMIDSLAIKKRDSKGKTVKEKPEKKTNGH